MNEPLAEIPDETSNKGVVHLSRSRSKRPKMSKSDHTHTWTSHAVLWEAKQ